MCRFFMARVGFVSVSVAGVLKASGSFLCLRMLRILLPESDLHAIMELPFKEKRLKLCPIAARRKQMQELDYLTEDEVVKGVENYLLSKGKTTSKRVIIKADAAKKEHGVDLKIKLNI